MKKPIPKQELGKLPPQDTEVEKTILAALIMSPKAIFKVRSILKDPEIFYKESHQVIYKAISDMCDRNEDIDLVTLTNHVRKNGDLERIGGALFITEITTKANSDDHIEAHAEIIKNLWAKREQINLAQKVLMQGYDDTVDPGDTFAEIHTATGKISSLLGAKQQKSVRDIVNSSLNRFERTKTVPWSEQFISTGIEVLDRKISGFRSPSPRLIVIGGAPGMGKSTMLMQVAKANVLRDIPIGIISLEMEEEDWVDKMIVSELHGKYSNYQMETGRWDKEDWIMIENVGSELATKPLHLYAPPSMELFEIRLLALEWVAKYGIRCLGIDYLQQAKVSGSANAKERVSELAYGLKALAKEIRIPIIAISSMSRAHGSDTRPQLSHLKESGDIEYAADQVIFPYRKGYYDKAYDQSEIEYIVAKNRGGPDGVTEISYYDPATNRYSSRPILEYVSNSFPVPKPAYGNTFDTKGHQPPF